MPIIALNHSLNEALTHCTSSCRQRANTGQTFLAKSLYLSFFLNSSGAIAPRLSNNDPCTSNCGKLILAREFTKSD